MKILIVSPWINTGVTSQVEYLARNGHDITVIIEEISSASHLSDSTIWEQLRSENRVFFLENRTLSKYKRRLNVMYNLLRALRDIPKIVHTQQREQHNILVGNVILEAWISNICKHSKKWNVIHAHDASTGSRIARLVTAGILDGPLVVSVKGADVLRDTPEMLNARYKNMFSTAAKVLVQTEYVANRISKTSFAARDIIRLPSTVDDEAIKPTKRTSASPPTRLLCVGRMLELKGQKYAIDALSLLRAKQIDATLTIVGTGQEEQNLQRRAAELGVTPHVRFLGRLSHKQTLDEMGQHDILLHPCINVDGQEEAMGLVMLEAQLKGMLCIVSDSGGAPETIKHNVSGHVVPQRDPDAIAKSVLNLLENKDHWPEMRSAGRTHVIQNFSISTQGPKLVEIYKAVSVL